MANYEKPFVLLDEGIGEGVFMASGSSDCWTVSAPSVQEWTGSHHVFQVNASHSKSAQHITTQVEYTIEFTSPVVDAYAENGYECKVSGNKVTVIRNLHANGYGSGDAPSFKVWVKAADEATTKSIASGVCTSKCRHETNVQGGID